jgi:hypothetical protein
MSLNPSPQPLPEAGNSATDAATGSQAAPSQSAAADAPPSGGSRPARIWTMCFIILTFEIGGFLVLFPWREAWHLNHFPTLFPAFFDVWDSPFFRGAVSGLGVVNLLIAVTQSVYLFRSSKNS